MAVNTIEKIINENYKSNYRLNLILEKHLVELNFDWLKLRISNKAIIGSGRFYLEKKYYDIEINYSPFFLYRNDRVYLRSENFSFDERMHVYSDLSLCLYHPVIDKSPYQIIPLYKLIPRVIEWCIYYENFKLYKVWLGKEIKH